MAVKKNIETAQTNESKATKQINYYLVTTVATLLYALLSPNRLQPTRFKQLSETIGHEPS